MANSRQATKRARQGEKHRLANASARSRLRTMEKKVRKAILAGDKAAASAALAAAIPVIDSAAGAGLIHRNKAARDKSRLNAAIKAMG